MKFKYKIEDATKEELIRYFFGVDTFGGGFRVGADKARFLIWLEKKRNNEIFDAMDVATTESSKSLEKYIQYIKEANDEKDIEKKLSLLKKADAAYKQYEKYNKQYDLLNSKISPEADYDENI